MDDITVAELKKLIVNQLPNWIEYQPDLRHRLRRTLIESSTETPGRMTYEEFLNWADEGTLAEWVDGEIIVTSLASARHQLVAGFLEMVMGIFAQRRGLGVVLSAPFQMKLDHGREPDLLFVASENLGRLRESHLNGPADLVVEIVSPESIGRDRGEKFYEYETAGVPEYWLIDPQRRWADFFQLADQRYRPAFSGASGRYGCKQLPGFWLEVAWLWQEPLPSPIRVLGEIAGIDLALLDAFEHALGKRNDEP